MARPLKQGIDYFPLDTVLDDKFSLIEAEFGCKGFAVVVKLYQKIYSERGYYCEWTPEVALMFTRKYCPDVGLNAVSEIVEASIRRGLFDRELFKQYHILTSKGIQVRYLEAVKKRLGSKIEECYLLINNAPKKVNASNNEVNVRINSENVSENNTNKRKENKRKENKNKEDDKAVVTIFKYYMQNINPTPTATEIETLKYWIDNGFEEQLLIECINVAVKSNARNLRYVEGILKNLDNKGIKTLEAFKNSEKIRSEEQTAKKEQKKNGTKFSNFEQRDYSKKTEELENLCQKMLDDFLND